MAPFVRNHFFFNFKVSFRSNYVYVHRRFSRFISLDTIHFPLGLECTTDNGGAGNLSTTKELMESYANTHA